MVRRISIQIILILCVSAWGSASVQDEAADLTFILRAHPIQISHQKGEAIPFNPRESTRSVYFRLGLFVFIRNTFRHKTNLCATSLRAAPDSGWGQSKSTASFVVCC